MGTNATDTLFSQDLFVTKVLGNDKEAQTQLVSAYTTPLFRAALGLGFNTEDADELVQKTWLTFFENLHRFERKSHIKTYLFGILYMTAKNLKRANQKQFKMDLIDSIIDQDFAPQGEWIQKPVDPHKFAERLQDAKNIKDCLDDIPLNYRMAFTLKEIEECSTSEICKILEVTDTNLGVLLFRAKNKLRKCLETKL
jgi:RNA polymerase sigma-70 factor (ECF subfamily)